MLIGCLSIKKYFSKFLQTKPSIVDKEGVIYFKVTAGCIKFNNILFSYANNKLMVKKISFTVKSEKTITLIKLTRSGKSTLLNLLKRFIDPSKGSIKINGQNISNITLRSLQENIVVIPQNLKVLNKSIREIVLYRLYTNNIKIIKSCKAAFIYE